jgi:hypothetical protein
MPLLRPRNGDFDTTGSVNGHDFSVNIHYETVLRVMSLWLPRNDSLYPNKLRSAVSQVHETVPLFC